MHENIKAIENEEEITWESFFIPFKKFVLSVEFFVNHLDYYDVVTNGIKKYDYPELEEFERVKEILNEIILNDKIKDLICYLANNENDERKIILQVWLNDFFSLILEDDKRKKYHSLKHKLETEVELFSKNLSLTSKQDNILFIPKKDYFKLDGLNKMFINIGETNAASLGRRGEGCVFIIEDGTVSLFLKILKNRQLRKTLYQKHKKLCSANNKNNEVLKKIISLKQRISLLYGKKNYAELVLSNYLLSDIKSVYSYLERIENNLSPYLENILCKMRSLAKKNKIVLQHWDMLYYYELASGEFKAENNIKNFDKEFSCFFPFEKAITNVFKFIEKTFYLSINEVNRVVINKELLIRYLIKDLKSNRETYLEVSPYSSDEKINPFQVNKSDFQNLTNKEYIKGVILLSLSFDGSYKEDALLSFKDICILLHELGHALHSFFINNKDCKLGNSYTSWDLIELPSQLMEEMAFNYEFLYQISDKQNGIFSKKLFYQILEYEQVEKIYSLHEEITKHKALLWLYENFKIHSKKAPQELIDEVSHNKYGIYNILLDEFMSETNHLSDYAPASYIYLFTGILANKIINKESEYFQGKTDFRLWYENIFNEQEVVDTKLKDVLIKVLNIEKVDIVKYIKKGHNIKLFGENNV